MKEQRYVCKAENIEIEVTKKQIKSLRLCVHPDGRVTCSAPYYMPRQTVDGFIASKLDWIRARQEAAKQAAKNEDLVFGERCSPPLDEAQKRELLRQYIAFRMPYFEDLTGISCSGFYVRDMSTRWGSCTVSTRKIRFALRLVTRTKSEIDCVILHELIHIRVPNHGDAFKAQMSRYMPDWRERQSRMKT